MSNTLQTFLKDSNILLSVSNAHSKTSQILALLTALTAMSAICGFVQIPVEPIYYGSLILTAIILIYHGSSKVSGALVFLYLIILLNVAIVDIPSFFKPYQRAGLFILMTLTTTSVFKTEWAITFRRQLFSYIVYGLIVLSVGSFFCFFLGINLMSRRSILLASFDAYSSNGGWFGGLTVHSMMLGPISMVVALFFYVMFLEKQRRLYLVLFFMSAMSAVFASSRAALLGMAVAMAYSLIFGRFGARMKRRMMGLFLVCTLFTLPIADVAFRGVLNKQENRVAQNDGNLNSRQEKFDYRIAEFKKSPLLGVGFCAIDINGGDGYSSYDGRIEPGTSHLSVLSMTGLLGMAAYLIILYQAYRNAKGTDSAHARFVLLCFIAMFVHAWFEGYVFSAGGFLAFLYWLIVGQCIDCNTDSQQIATV